MTPQQQLVIDKATDALIKALQPLAERADLPEDLLDAENTLDDVEVT